MSKKTFIFLLVLVTTLLEKAFATLFIDVRIYATVEIQKTDITIFSGKYDIYNNENSLILTVYKNSTITFSATDSIVNLMQNDKVIAQSKKFFIKGVGLINTFKVSPIKPAFAIRIYDDNLKILARRNNLLLINNVELEDYIAGVVESEGGGSTKDVEFFLVQAIICRTYALANIRKHELEGFHLCDDVHCQLYKGRATLSYITMAAQRTEGKVIVSNDDNKMISAAFHSNSGGQTMNSEDVWSLKTSYLRSIKDTFSLAMKNARWQKKMLTSDWLNYLQKTYNYPIEDPLKREEVLNFRQPERKAYLYENIHLKDIRRDLNLRSTFFNIIHKGDTVVFDGRGFGHGVGMSQEGAIRMIQLGYTHQDVIMFYYRNVRIVSFEELDYFKINYTY